MAVSMAQFAAELRAFDARRTVVQKLRRQLSKPVPVVRSQIRTHALATLPGRGGLGAWAAASRVSATVRYTSGRSAGIRLKGSRKSLKGKSDLNRLDAGRLRAPSWGHRTRASWHSQSVAPGWFSDPVRNSPEWGRAVEQAVDDAFAEIRG